MASRIHASVSFRSASDCSGGMGGSCAGGGVWSQVTTGGGVGTATGRVELFLHAGRALAHSAISSRLGQVDRADFFGGVIGGGLDFRELGVERDVQVDAGGGGIGGALRRFRLFRMGGDGVGGQDLLAAGFELARAVVLQAAEIGRAHV